MKISRCFSGLLAAFAVTCAHADSSVIYIAATETEELKAKDGQRVTVYGETSGAGKSSSGTNFVNFKEGEFYLVTFKTDLNLFPKGEPADLYDGKRIAVTGVMSIYRGKPQFKLTSPEQVRVLEADEEFPPKQEEMKEAPEPEAKPEATPETESKPEEESKRKPPVDPSEYFK